MIVYDDKKSASTSNLLAPPQPSFGLHNTISESDLVRFNNESPIPPPPRRHGLPPPYANALAGPSNLASTSFSRSTLSLPSTSTGITSSNTHIQLPHRSNHLYITRPLGLIKGSWIIDTSLRLPSAFLPPIEEGTTRKNLRLHAKQGKISARVEIKGRMVKRRATSPESTSTTESFGDGRADLFFRSDSHNIKLRLVSVSHGSSIGTLRVLAAAYRVAPT